MGMKIDEAIKHGTEQLEIFGGEHKEFIEVAIDTMRKYQMFQAKYIERLKADMVAMLTEIQLEIEELDSRAGYDGNGMPTFSADYIRKRKVNELIQQKINALRGNE